jgi:hypothetical protein
LRSRCSARRTNVCSSSPLRHPPLPPHRLHQTHQRRRSTRLTGAPLPGRYPTRTTSLPSPRRLCKVARLRDDMCVPAWSSRAAGAGNHLCSEGTQRGECVALRALAHVSRGARNSAIAFVIACMHVLLDSVRRSYNPAPVPTYCEPPGRRANSARDCVCNIAALDGSECTCKEI